MECYMRRLEPYGESGGEVRQLMHSHYGIGDAKKLRAAVYETKRKQSQCERIYINMFSKTYHAMNPPDYIYESEKTKIRVFGRLYLHGSNRDFIII